MGEKLILGLQIGEPVSLVRDRKNLQFVLTQTHERRLVSIDKIRHDLIGAIKAEIPIDFLFAAGLAELNWQQIYHPNALSAVYLGVKEKPISPVKFSDSEAIIAIHSNVYSQQVKAVLVEMSCVVADSKKRKRVLSVLYDAHDLKAIRGLVSIAENEKSKFPFDVHPDDPKDEEARLITIPTIIDGSFFLPSWPLVSLRMSQLAQEDTKMVEANAGGQHWYILFRDYFQEIKENNIVIGRRETPGKPSWEVSFPASLIPVKNN